MAEFLPSSVQRPSRRSWLPALTAVVGLVVGVAIVKPWGDSARPVQPTAGAAATVPSTRPEPTVRPPRTAYDPRLFGTREPDPAWELWPAGYVVQFGIAGPLPVHSPGPPAPATAQPDPSRPVARASPAASPRGPVIDLGSADHLIALGINTPADVRVVEIGLWILRGDGCCAEPVPFVRLPTLWDSEHFLVIAAEDPSHTGQPGPWRVAEYRLDLVLLSNQVRSIAFEVTAPLG